MTPRTDVCGKQLVKRAAEAPEDPTVHKIIVGQKPSAGLHLFPIVGITSDTRVTSLPHSQVPRLIWCFLDFPFLVICNFRSPICQALVLEIGETVQILEKSEGEANDRKCGSEGPCFQPFLYFVREYSRSWLLWETFHPKAHKIKD